MAKYKFEKIEDMARYNGLNRKTLNNHTEKGVYIYQIYDDENKPIVKEFSENQFDEIKRLVKNLGISHIHFENDRGKRLNMIEKYPTAYNAVRKGNNQNFRGVDRHVNFYYEDDLKKFSVLENIPEGYERRDYSHGLALPFNNETNAENTFYECTPGIDFSLSELEDMKKAFKEYRGDLHNFSKIVYSEYDKKLPDNVVTIKYANEVARAKRRVNNNNETDMVMKQYEFRIPLLNILKLKPDTISVLKANNITNLMELFDLLTDNNSHEIDINKLDFENLTDDQQEEIFDNAEKWENKEHWYQKAKLLYERDKKYIY